MNERSSSGYTLSLFSLGLGQDNEEISISFQSFEKEKEIEVQSLLMHKLYFQNDSQFCTFEIESSCRTQEICKKQELTLDTASIQDTAVIVNSKNSGKGMEKICIIRM